MPRSVLTAVFVCGLLAVVVAGGCRARVTPGGAQGSRADKARKQAVELAVDGVKGAAVHAETLTRANPGGTGTFGKAVATAGKAATSNVGTPAPAVGGAPATQASDPSLAPPAPTRPPKSSPRPGSPPVIKERVVNALPFPTEAEADDDALAAARDLIERRLLELDPPVRYRPSLNEVKQEFVRPDTRKFTLLKDAKEEDFSGAEKLREEVAKRYAPDDVARLGYVEYQVEITAAQIRELRTRDRLSITLRVFGGVAVVALAGFLFLRADEWTKGYLTRWLAVAAVLLTGAAAAALYFV